MQDNLSLFEADGYSMEPMLRRGDRLVLRRVSAGELRVGDIVLAEIDGRKVCHRVIGLDSTGGSLCLLLRGDASFSQPDRVPFQACLGKVSSVIKSGGAVSLETFPQRVISRLAIYLFPALMGLRRFAARLLGR
ncbi:MAG: hypothetical protein GX410_04745 [Elusimicrobia bacterium]|nr:hypothetical protein [Elusimicrobiota bacterium]